MARFAVYASDFRSARHHLHQLDRHIPATDWVFISSRFFPQRLQGVRDLPTFVFEDGLDTFAYRRLRDAASVGIVRLIHTSSANFREDFDRCLN